MAGNESVLRQSHGWDLRLLSRAMLTVEKARSSLPPSSLGDSPVGVAAYRRTAKPASSELRIQL